MDKLKRLQALSGQENIVDNDSKFEPFMFPTPKPAHIYEGTDSEDDEIVTSRGTNLNKNVQDPIEPIGPPSEFDGAPHDFEEYRQLQLGELAKEGEGFCPFQAIKKYPYTYIGVANRQTVASGFFDQGKLLNHTWDFFYIHPSISEFNQQPILLVPTRQFTHFLSIINRKMNTRLTIPTGGANGSFQVKFTNDGTPQPRYLGRSTNRNRMEHLRNAAPPIYYKLGGEPDAIKPNDRSLAAFRHKIDLMQQAQRGKKLVSKEKQKTKRIAKQQSWNHCIKRVQRYLGLRQIRRGQHALIRSGLENSGLQWADYDAAVKAAAALLPPSAAFVPDQPAPFTRELDVVFVCVDVEAYERNASIITEIGIATLDTRELASVIPGEGGANWMKIIRARHFRINEHKHYQNGEFVEGCADRFEFGTSEFINLKDAPHIVANCFKYPFSGHGDVKSATEKDIKRNVILVGHDVAADVNYIRSVGYEIYNLGSLKEQVDTISMWRYLKRESNPRNLGSILAELRIVAWNLHNAGNDAVYTLQAMLAIAIKHLTDRDERDATKEQEKRNRISESVKEATEAAILREQGWSSDDSDGGAPVPPPKSKKVAGSQPAGDIKPKYSDSPWKPNGRKNKYSSDGPYNQWGGQSATPAKAFANAGASAGVRVEKLENSMKDMKLEKQAPKNETWW